MELRSHHLYLIPLLALACDKQGSLGNYEDDGGQSSGQGSASASVGDDDDGGPGGTGPGPGTTGTDGGGMTDPPGSGTDPGDEGWVTTGAPGACGPESCEVYDACELNPCGPLGPLDENGCVRISCIGNPDGCPDGQLCYVAEDFGGCSSSSFFCEDDPEQDVCSCASTDDCSGAWCVDADDYPQVGPEGVAEAQNGCAPDDSPALIMRIGLETGGCDWNPNGQPGIGELEIAIYDFALSVDHTPGAYSFVGTDGGYAAMQDVADEQQADSGTLTITDFADGVVSGTYALDFAGTIVSGAFTRAVYCDGPFNCG